MLKLTYYVVLACMWHKNSHFKKSVNSPGTQCIVGTIRFRILKSYIRTKFYVLCFQKIQSKELGLWGNFAFTTYFFSALSLATGGVYFIHLKNCGRFRSVLQITNVSLDYLLFVLCHKSILQRILKNPEPSYIFIAFFDQRTLGRFCSTYPSENQMFLILHHFVSKWILDYISYGIFAFLHPEWCFFALSAPCTVEKMAVDRTALPLLLYMMVKGYGIEIEQIFMYKITT